MLRVSFRSAVSLVITMLLLCNIAVMQASFEGRSPSYVAFIVYDSLDLEDWEDEIYDSVSANHTVDIVDDDDVDTTDLTGYDVILWAGWQGLQPHIRDLITYQGLNMVLVGDALMDLTTIYGGKNGWQGAEANATITTSHPVVTGFSVGSNAVLSREKKWLERTPYMTYLDSEGMISVGEPNGRVVAIGAVNDMYLDGFTIIDNAIEWAAGGSGTEQTKPYSREIAYIVGRGDDPDYDYGYEGAIYQRLLQDGYDITPIDEEDVGTTDFSGYEVVLSAYRVYLQPYIRDLVTYKGINLVLLGNALDDLTSIYGGTGEWLNGEANTTIKTSHDITSGFSVNSNVILSEDGYRIDKVPYMTMLDEEGVISFWEPNGRFAVVGASGSMYPDGYQIAENAIEWAAGGSGTEQTKPYSREIAYIVDRGDDPDYDYWFEGAIYQRLLQDGYDITPIDEEDVGTTDFSGYEVVLSVYREYLQPYIRDLVTYKGINLVLLGNALDDLTTIYGGTGDWINDEANVTIKTSHDITSGFSVNSNVILSSDGNKIDNAPYMTMLDEEGVISVCEPNGRLAVVGASSCMYPDGYQIAENAIEWAAGGSGTERSRPYSREIACIVGRGDDPNYDYWFEGAIYQRLLQDGYNVTPVDDEAVAETDFSDYDVILESYSYLEGFLSTYVNTSGFNVVALGEGMQDVADAYGGNVEWVDGETNTQIKFSHPVVDGYSVDDYVILSADGNDLIGSTLTRLDVNGEIWVGEPNGRIVALTSSSGMYQDGFRILENAIEWASGWEGTQKEGNFSVSASPSSATTSVGGEVSFRIRLHNLESVSDTFQISVEGIGEDWRELSDEEVFLFPGEIASIDLDISVPNSLDSVGTHSIEIIMESSNLNSNRSYPVVLVVDRDPILRDLYPRSCARSASPDVLFSWRTSVSSSTHVFLMERGESNYTEYEGEDGIVHSLSVSGLVRDTVYDFYVESSTEFGSVQSEVRALHIENGISFDKRTYNVTIDRDYNQITKIGITNSDVKPHKVLVTVSHPYDDFIVGFTGNGSRDRMISMAPGQSMGLTLAIHAQNVLGTGYHIILNLSSISTSDPDDVIYDTAEVNVKVHEPNIDFTMEVVATNEFTLAKTIRVVNNGDILTDFTVRENDELKGKVLFRPQIHHGYLGVDDAFEFEISPVLSVDFSGLSGKIVAEGYDQEVEMPIDFQLPEGARIFYGDADYTVHSDKNPLIWPPPGGPPGGPMGGPSGSYCLNKVVNDRPFEVPSFIRKCKKLFNYPGKEKPLINYGCCGVRGNLIRPDVNEYLDDFSSNNSRYSSTSMADGAYHTVWHTNDEGNINIFYMRSTDGYNVDSIQDISRSNSASRWPILATQENYYFIVWVENTTGGSEVFFSKSTDHGTNWDDPTPLTSSANNVDDPFIRIDSDCALHLVWESIHSGGSDILYMNSSDHGSSWSEIRVIANSSGSSEYPSLSVDPNDTVHVIWEDHRNGLGQIFYINTTDGGNTWNEEMILSNSPADTGEPSIAVTPNNRIHVAWRDSRHGESEIYYRNSSDGGSNWHEEVRLTNDPSYSEYPVIIAYKDDSVKVVWHDNRTGDDWLYYRDGCDWPEMGRVERNLPNIEEVFFEMSFKLQSQESSYIPHDVSLSMNGNEIGALTDTVPNGKYIFNVDPDHLIYGNRVVATNEVTTTVSGMGVGHFIVATDYNVIFHLSYVDMPVVADNLTHADEIVKGLTTGAWEGVDPAVYVNDISLLETRPNEGEETTITARVRNLGEDDVSDVVISFHDGDPENGGIQIGSDVEIPIIGSYSWVDVNTSWTSSGGRQRIFVVVDGDNMIEETDETNNVASFAVYVWSDTPPWGSILINGGENITDNRSVMLNLTVWGINPVSLMTLSNDNRTWTDYEEFTWYREWVLSEGDGIKTVYVKFMDASGLVSDLFFDDIILRKGGIVDENDTDGDGFTDEDERILGTDPDDPEDFPGSDVGYVFKRAVISDVEILLLAKSSGNITIEGVSEGSIPDDGMEGYRILHPVFIVTADSDIQDIRMALKVGSIGGSVIPSEAREDDIKLGYLDESNTVWDLTANSTYSSETGILSVDLEHLTIFAPVMKEAEDGDDDDEEPSNWALIALVVIIMILIMVIMIFLVVRFKASKGSEAEE